MVASTRFVVTDPAQLYRVTDRPTAEVAQGLAADAAQLTPRETGTLAAGWRAVQHSDGRWDVVNDVPYARYVEFGSKGHPPVAMLGRAAAQARNRYA